MHFLLSYRDSVIIVKHVIIQYPKHLTSVNFNHIDYMFYKQMQVTELSTIVLTSNPKKICEYHIF